MTNERATGWRWRWQRICAVMRVECMRLLRDRPTLALIVVVPAVQILLFGAAVNLNPRGLKLAIAHSAQLDPQPALDAANATGYFASEPVMLPGGAARRAVQAATAELAIEWSATEAPQIIADATDPAEVRPAALALAGELQRASARALAAAAGIEAADRLSARYAPRIEWLHNPTASTTWAVAPGLVGVVVMITMLLLGALTLVREREQGSWESLLTTAVDGVDALIGKLTPYVLLGMLQAAIVVVSAHILFAVPVVGSFWVLMAAAAVLALAHLLLGFALSAIASTQLQAIQSAVFFYLPSMLLSGFMFPFAGMPRWAQRAGECLPLTHFVRVARGVMLRGAGVQWALVEMWPVAVFAALAAALALIAYRRHLTQ